MKTMQAIIMAAGKGSRLGDITKGMPKSFLEINGEKLIERNINALKTLGVNDITVVIGYKDEFFRELLGNDSSIRLVYNPFYELANVIGSFYLGMKYLYNDFMYLHADTICDISILKELVNSEGDVVLPCDLGHCDNEAMKIRSENGNIVEISKSICNADADGEFIGIAKLSQRVLPDLKDKTYTVLKEENYSAYFEAALQKIIDMRKYCVIEIPTNDRFWAEIDFQEDYTSAQQRCLRKDK